MIRHHRIFSTYGATPTKNIPTPIYRVDNVDTETQEENANEYQEPIYTIENDPAVEMLRHIRLLLIIVIIVQIICLSKK